mmetsp:Transcript_7675/g.22751  ORF Transcript_7675/g.22751 Transcript_7675/m.22751 type:complete len:434 (+) Transcript_7675:121-1422(+)
MIRNKSERRAADGRATADRRRAPTRAEEALARRFDGAIRRAGLSAAPTRAPARRRRLGGGRGLRADTRHAARAVHRGPRAIGEHRARRPRDGRAVYFEAPAAPRPAVAPPDARGQGRVRRALVHALLPVAGRPRRRASPAEDRLPRALDVERPRLQGARAARHLQTPALPGSLGVRGHGHDALPARRAAERLFAIGADGGHFWGDEPRQAGRAQHGRHAPPQHAVDARVPGGLVGQPLRLHGPAVLLADALRDVGARRASVDLRRVGLFHVPPGAAGRAGVSGRVVPQARAGAGGRQVALPRRLPLRLRAHGVPDGARAIRESAHAAGGALQGPARRREPGAAARTARDEPRRRGLLGRRPVVLPRELPFSRRAGPSGQVQGPHEGPEPAQAVPQGHVARLLRVPVRRGRAGPEEHHAAAVPGIGGRGVISNQ